MVETGRILQFDDVRGYGFIAPDLGGDDVFLHVNDFDGDESLLSPGARVEFEVMEGGRGKKAFGIRITEDAEVRPVVAKPAPPVPVAPKEPEVDVMCDVLTTEELRLELTELFLSSVPELSGGQILRLREDILLLARKHGWAEE